MDTKIMLITSSIALVNFAPAADISWSGAGDGFSWSDGANWVGGAVPTASDRFNPEGSTITVDVPGAEYSTPLGSGNVIIADGASMAGNGSNSSVLRFVDFEIQGGGELAVSSLAQARTSVNILDGGILSGVNLVNGATMSIGGSWSPKDAAEGSDNIDLLSSGSVTLGATGQIYLDLFGDASNEYFNITASQASLDLSSGSILLAPQGGYVPTVGDVFDLWDNPGSGTIVSGDGSNISLAGFSLDVSSFATDGVVTVASIPEPSHFALVIAFGVVAVGLMRRRK